MGLKQTGLPRYLTPDPATLYKSGPQFGTTGVDPDIVRAPLRLSRACLGKSAATWWRCGRQARGPACCAVRRGPSFPSLSRRQLNALSDHVCARVVGGTVATFCYLQVAAARRALKEMIDYLTTVHGISPYEAMVLCSVAADFKIAEVVDSKSSPKVTP